MFCRRHHVLCLLEQFIGFLSYSLGLQLRQMLLSLVLSVWNCWKFCRRSSTLKDFASTLLYGQGKTKGILVYNVWLKTSGKAQSYVTVLKPFHAMYRFNCAAVKKVSAIVDKTFWDNYFVFRHTCMKTSLFTRNEKTPHPSPPTLVYLFYHNVFR